MNLSFSEQKKIEKIISKPERSIGWLDAEIQTRESVSDVWKWESLIMYHLKIDAREVSDDEFFDLCARLKFVIESEQKKNSLNTD